jgi:hypothetical protein
MQVLHQFRLQDMRQQKRSKYAGLGSISTHWVETLGLKHRHSFHRFLGN